MGVMPAGVHTAVNLRGKLETRALLSGQSIHLGAKCDNRRTAGATVKAGNYSSSLTSVLIINPQTIQFADDYASGLNFLEGELRVLMKGPSKVYHSPEYGGIRKNER
jgi:hypothetical protein